MQEMPLAPGNFALYDDAGAACDRLGRGDEALEWMAKKHAALDQTPDSGEKANHLYRYHANLGTFIIHRWLKNGASPEAVDEVRRSRDQIAAALEINPAAHWGREDFQLKAIEWIIGLIESPPVSAHENYQNRDFTSYPEFDPGSFLEIPLGHSHDLRETGRLRGRFIVPPVDGINGLIALGAAWESIDIFYSLRHAILDEGHTSLGHLAQCRIDELRDSGRTSLFEQLAGFRNDWGVGTFSQIHESQIEDIESYYEKARAEAERWRASRIAFIEEQLASGRHPDTHPDFWSGFRSPSTPPKLPNWKGSLSSGLDWSFSVILFAVPCSVVVLLYLLGVFRGHRNRL